MGSALDSKDSGWTQLDIVANEEVMRFLTSIAMCYSVPESISDDSIVNTLKNGASKLAAAFPWISGKVVKTNEGSKKPVYAIRHVDKIPLIVKDMRTDSSLPSMDSLKDTGFPESSGIFREDIIIQPGYAPKPGDDLESVFVIQVNFIRGGLILATSSHHQVFDMGGIYNVTKLLSQACHDIPFTEEQLKIGNISRKNVIPLLDPAELAKSMPPPNNEAAEAPSNASTTNDPQGPKEPAKGPYKRQHVNFKLTKQLAEQLKADASKDITIDFISTDDAITALTSRSVARARLSHMTPETPTKMLRAVDLRSHLNLSETYPGVAMFFANVDTDMKTLTGESLGTLAQKWRQSIDPKVVAGALSGVATAITAGMITIDCYDVLSNTMNDLLVSSWIKFDFYELDYNLGLGKPVAVRRPASDMTPMDASVYILPRPLNGDYDFMISLRDEDMERLKSDKEFTKYAQVVG